ncbi:hypothetical protein JXB02_03770 [Candidatus Woesearchaeota archaeon]|nr:hypothetical protein [Candidatus Woesearchaeota archaeon]
MIDIALPKGNERELVGMAERLGHDGLVLLYPYRKDVAPLRTRIVSLQRTSRPVLHLGLSCRQDQLKDARQKADILFGDPAQGARLLIEAKGCDAVYGLPYHARNDGIYHRAGGLDHVMAKAAAKGGTLICIGLAPLVSTSSPASLLARLRQNVMLCRKYKASYAVASFASAPYLLRGRAELAAFASVLGGDGAAVRALAGKLSENSRLKHRITDGVYSKP